MGRGPAIVISDRSQHEQRSIRRYIFDGQMPQSSGSQFDIRSQKAAYFRPLSHIASPDCRNARDLIFSPPRDQPCLCHWLVSPRSVERGLLPEVVPGSARVGLFLRLRSGLGTSRPSRRRYMASTQPRVTPPLQCAQLKPTNSTGQATAKIESAYLLAMRGATTITPLRAEIKPTNAPPRMLPPCLLCAGHGWVRSPKLWKRGMGATAAIR